MTEPSADAPCHDTVPERFVPEIFGGHRKFLGDAVRPEQRPGESLFAVALFGEAYPISAVGRAALYFGLKLESGGSFGNDDIAGSIDGYLSAV